jgi:hypothetical protein
MGIRQLTAWTVPAGIAFVLVDEKNAKDSIPLQPVRIVRRASSILAVEITWTAIKN